jgi:hypothetical protein
VVPITVVTAGRDGQLSVHVRSDDLVSCQIIKREQHVMADNLEEGEPPSAVFLSPPYRGGVPGIANYGPHYVVKLT